MLGGRAKAGELTEFYSDILKYSPSKGRWLPAGHLKAGDGRQLQLSAGTGVSWVRDKIILFGGDDGVLYNKTELFLNDIAKAHDPTAKQELTLSKNRHLQTHPGFNRAILEYSTVTEQCRKIGDIPVPTQVTTTAVKYKGGVIIPTGEIGPGVRTPRVNTVSIIVK